MFRTPLFILILLSQFLSPHAQEPCSTESAEASSTDDAEEETPPLPSLSALGLSALFPTALDYYVAPPKHHGSFPTGESLLIDLALRNNPNTLRQIDEFANSNDRDEHNLAVTILFNLALQKHPWTLATLKKYSSTEPEKIQRQTTAARVNYNLYERLSLQEQEELKRQKISLFDFIKLR